METEEMECEEIAGDADKVVDTIRRKCLKLHQDAFTSIVRGPYLTTFYTLMKQEHIEEVSAVDATKGTTSGAQVFLSKVLESGEVGWFMELVSALQAAGYHHLADCVNKLDFTPLDVLKEQRNIITKCRPFIEREIIPRQVLDSMNFLGDTDKQQVIQETDNHGDIFGAKKLIDVMLRSDVLNFLKLFIYALKEAGFEETSNYIEGKEDVYEEAVQSEYLKYTENPEKDDCEAVDMTSKLSQMIPDDQAVQPVDQAMLMDEPKRVMCGTVSLRLYQAELAESARKGENSIIVAPTDSGKTFVALAICDEHLSQRAGGSPRKVIFLAPTLPVFQQQYDRFCQHYNSTEVTVGRVCGMAGTPEPLEPELENNDVLIMTPQTLLNGFENEKVCSITDFSLIIFDECHHTSKNHPYNVIMQHYLRVKYGVKYGLKAHPLPQIVGLTASVGVGNNKSLKGAIDHVLQLCANLDTCAISTVQRYSAELAAFVPIAEHNVIKVAVRHADPFADIVKGIMAKVEELLFSLALPDDVTLSKKEHECGTQPYEQWVTAVQKQGRMISIPSDNELEKMFCWSIFSCTSHLRKYNDALLINDDTRSKDALQYLDKFFASMDSKGFIDIDKALVNLFKEKRSELGSCIHNPENENPKLVKLKEVLRAEYSSNASTKCILFVKTRAIAEAMANWLNEMTEDLPHLKASKLVGRAKRKEHEGMTLSQQSGALDVFREEQGSNLLIATSVADEGLDIQRCNLVLLYDYVGNVIKSVQTRGRGRAQNSKCMLITSTKSGLAEKEKVNLLMEKVMYSAIKHIQKIDPATVTETITNLQMKSLTSANMQRTLQGSAKPDGEMYKLLCSKCKVLVCKSSDIRLVEKTHYTVMSSAFMELAQQKPHHKPASFAGFAKVGKIMHKTCMNDWGITAIYSGLKLPFIKIQGFVFQKENSNQQLSFRQWKDFRVTFADFSFEEIAQIGEDPVWLSNVS